MAPVETGIGQRTRECKLTGAPASSDGRVFRRSGTGLCFAWLLLALSPMVQAHDRQIKISNSGVLVLTSYVLVERVAGTSDAPLYAVVLQKNPFIEIHLRNPVPESRLTRRRLRFSCEKIGVFTDQRLQQTWTIGKACKPL